MFWRNSSFFYFLSELIVNRILIVSIDINKICPIIIIIVIIIIIIIIIIITVIVVIIIIYVSSIHVMAMLFWII